MIWEKFNNGIIWRRMMRSLWLSVLTFKKWRLIIKNQEVWLKIMRFLTNNERTWIWTSLWVYLVLVDIIWFGVADRTTKSTHFLPIKTSYSAEDYDMLYIWELVKLAGGPLSIISNKVLSLQLNFRDCFKRVFGTQLKLSKLFTLRAMVKRMGKE